MDKTWEQYVKSANVSVLYYNSAPYSHSIRFHLVKKNSIHDARKMPRYEEILLKNLENSEKWVTFAYVTDDLGLFYPLVLVSNLKSIIGLFYI